MGGFVSYGDCRTAGAEWEGAGVPQAPQVRAQSHSRTFLLQNANSAPLSHPVLKSASDQALDGLQHPSCETVH